MLVTGPTGAGKTTTLYSALAYLGSIERNILTVEDPVEYQIPTIRQTQIRPKAGFTFGTAIRSLLRQDPDVIMIGEIRDPETAQLALRAALSGILVFSTLHYAGLGRRRASPDGHGARAVPAGIGHGGRDRAAADADSSARLQSRNLVSGGDAREVGLAPDPDLVFYRGRGCDKCGGTGYRGRTGAFEILVVDTASTRSSGARADSRLIKQAAVSAGHEDADGRCPGQGHLRADHAGRGAASGV